MTARASQVEERIGLSKIETIVLQGGLIKGPIALQLIAELRVALAAVTTARTAGDSWHRVAVDMEKQFIAAETALTAAQAALKLASTRLDICADRMNGCNAEGGKHELVDEVRAFAQEALAGSEGKVKDNG